MDLKIDWDRLREKVRKEMGWWDRPLKPLGVSILRAAEGYEDIRRAFEIVEKGEAAAAMRAKPKNKLFLTLNLLRSLGVKMGVVTMQSMRPAVLALCRLKILWFFEVVVTREFSFSRKEQLYMALRAMNANPEETVFLGDLPSDMEAGSEIGCRTILIGDKADWSPRISSFSQILGVWMDPPKIKI